MNPRPFPKASQWFSVKNETEEAADVFIYDVIGESWDGESVSAKDFISRLNGMKRKKLNIRINSPGGSVFDGVAIYNAIANHEAEVTTVVEGLAASIASIIALAGKTVKMAENATYMIHNPWTLAWGDAAAMRKMADSLDVIKDTLVNTYERRTKKDRKAIADAMDEETWFTAQTAKQWGFVDEVIPGVEARACVTGNTIAALNFAKAPQSLAEEPLSATAPRSLRTRRLALLGKL